MAAAGGVVDYYRAVHEHHGGSASDDDVTAVRGAFELFAAQEQALMTPLAQWLTARDGVRLVGSPSADHAVRAPTFAFVPSRSSSADVVQALVDARINCGNGNFYAYRLTEALGLDPEDGVVRLSLVHYNSRDEVDRALEVLDSVL